METNNFYHGVATCSGCNTRNAKIKLLGMIGRLEFHAVFYLTSFSEGTYRSHVEMENEEVELEIADTAGEVWCFFIWLFVL